MYITVPNAVNPTPTHHHLSALYGSDGGKIFPALCIGMFTDSALLFTRLLPVACAADLDVGFRVCVGNIAGGEAARNIGFIGEPSNLKRFNRGTLW